MLHFIQGDIFESPAQYIVNPVNTRGIMGKGLALAFKKKYPKSAEDYVGYCKNVCYLPGTLYITHIEGERPIINFATKDRWQDNSKIEYIENGLDRLRNHIEIMNSLSQTIFSIAIPALGCGLGNLDWEDVKELIIKFLGDIEGVDFFIYESL